MPCSPSRIRQEPNPAARSLACGEGTPPKAPAARSQRTPSHEADASAVPTSTRDLLRRPRGDAEAPIRAAQELTGDHDPLDLARALVDFGDLGVAVVALGRELARVPVPA